MFNDVHVVPAYGRDYKSRAAVMADWNAGKDFKHAVTGQYLSKRDAEQNNLTVWIRYSKMTKMLKAH
jgi:hypothetical protein